MDRLELVAEQNLFYRNNYRKLLKVSAGIVLLNFILLSIIFYEYYTRPIPKYFATTNDGRLIEISPL
jgi:intracellular multiplication protein IcmL